LYAGRPKNRHPVGLDTIATPDRFCGEGDTMSDSSSKIALVTGGTRGIGRATVEALLRRGERVWFTGRNPENVARAEGELHERYPPPLAVGRVCDVRDFDAVAALVDEIVSSDGRLDVLVNNAGVGGFAPIDELEPERFREIVETNLFGAFHGMRAAGPVMRRQGSGWIFNIASLAAKNPMAGGAAYNASKFGLLGLSDAAMLDLRQAGIRVAAICPGSVETDFGAGRMRDGQSWRLQPEDVARVVTDLLEFPERALPSRIELRPTKPPKK
jgi:NAD(P)-dependent dehydrogenase (short-subunit alcohol dehydrogenase family)